MAYRIKDHYHKHVVKLRTKIKNVANLKLLVYREDSNTPKTYHSHSVTDLGDGVKVLEYVIRHSDFEIGTVIEKVIAVLGGNYNLFDLNEKITILVDGEVSKVGMVVNGKAQVDKKNEINKWVNPLTTNKFALKFKDNDPHTIQAVYKGNNEIGIAFSDKLTITPKQTVATYVLTSKIPKTMKYMQTPNFKWKLTKNGKPVSGKNIEVVLPTVVWTLTTNSRGEVSLTSYGDDISPWFYKWEVGEYKIGGQFFHYMEQDLHDKSTLCETWDTITIVKNTPHLNFIKAGQKGGSAQFILTDPQNKPMPNKVITIVVGSQTYTKTTDSLGKVYLRINRTGNFKYKATYAGDKNYNSVTINADETING